MKPELKIALVLQRGQRLVLSNDGKWGLPEDSLQYAETKERCVRRISEYVLGCDVTICSQVGIFDDPDRVSGNDHIVTIAYSVFNKGFIDGIDTKRVKAFEFDNIPELKEGHQKIVNMHLYNLKLRRRGF